MNCGSLRIAKVAFLCAIFARNELDFAREIRRAGWIAGTQIVRCLGFDIRPDIDMRIEHLLPEQLARNHDFLDENLRRVAILERHDPDIDSLADQALNLVLGVVGRLAAVSKKHEPAAGTFIER